MRLTIRLLGIDFLDVSIETDAAIDYDEPGDCMSIPFGFVPTLGDDYIEETE